MHCEKSVSFSFRFETKITLSRRNEKFDAKKGEIMGPFFIDTRIGSQTDAILFHFVTKRKPAHCSSSTANLGRTPLAFVVFALLTEHGNQV
jgi:hypothetical protein